MYWNELDTRLKLLYNKIVISHRNNTSELRAKEAAESAHRMMEELTLELRKIKEIEGEG